MTTWTELTHFPGVRPEQPTGPADVAGRAPSHGLFQALLRRFGLAAPIACGRESCPSCAR